MFTILGLYTLVHVVISLLGIGSGVPLMYGFLTSKQSNLWTHVFLFTTILTSVTGFGFPADHIMPSHILGVLSLLVLGLAVFARHARKMQGIWYKYFVVSASVAFYLNAFVLVVQVFSKIPVLKATAPTQTEPTFLLAQSVLLVGFVILTVLSVRRDQPSSLTNTQQKSLLR